MRRRLAFDRKDDRELVAAGDIEAGEEVCFDWSAWNYVVETVETTRLGEVRHRTRNDTMTCTYHPGELLWVRIRDVPSPLGHLGRQPPPQPR